MILLRKTKIYLVQEDEEKDKKKRDLFNEIQILKSLYISRLVAIKLILPFWFN